ncbi:MAG: gfo/Idh/MocA family oxidoreductase, partial [Candidatus Hydrogenedentota bacterium]
MAKTWRIAGLDFDHMHMGDNLRMAHEHPSARIVGVCDEDPTRMASAIRNFGLANDAVFTDYRKCLEETEP